MYLRAVLSTCYIISLPIRYSHGLIVCLMQIERGGKRVFGVFRDQVMVVFISNLLVDILKV